MKAPGQTVHAPRVEIPDGNVAAVACIDLDRFCRHCGYNLRTRPVHLEPTTGIPIVRCPECGGFESADTAATALHPWLDRVTSILLFLWILALIGLVFHIGLAEGAISYATFNELTMHSVTTRQQATTSGITWYRDTGPLVVKPAFAEYELFIAAVMACSLGLGLATGILSTIVFPHWSRSAHAALALMLPFIAGVFALLVWRSEAPHLVGWGLAYILGHAGAQLTGGWLGIRIGRPCARLAVRILLPPGLQPKLAYLWLADRKTPPTTSTLA